MPSDPTLYVCAQQPEESKGLINASKFEIIMNAPPSSKSTPNKEEEFKLCQKRTYENLKKMG